MIRPEYFQTRFRTETPPGEWPDRFAVVTAWNPNGEFAALEGNIRLGQQLALSCKEHALLAWPVSGGSPDWRHQEEGLGIVTDLSDALAIGRLIKQEAIFWVEQGTLSVISARVRRECSWEAGQGGSADNEEAGWRRRHRGFPKVQFCQTA